MKKTFFALLISIVLALVTLVGCGGNGSAVTEKSSQVTLESAQDELQSAPEEVQSAGDILAQSQDLQSEPDSTGNDAYDSESAGQSSSDTRNNNETNASTDANNNTGGSKSSGNNTSKAAIDKNGTYTSKEDVALYIHTYGRLPKNFMTKKEAKKLGWEGGSLEKYAKGMCIGGDYFGNYEGILPDGNYHECDIDTLGKKSRGAKRIIYSDDGRIYYTDDHYESFELLYGEE